MKLHMSSSVGCSLLDGITTNFQGYGLGINSTAKFWSQSQHALCLLGCTLPEMPDIGQPPLDITTQDRTCMKIKECGPGSFKDIEYACCECLSASMHALSLSVMAFHAQCFANSSHLTSAFQGTNFLDIAPRKHGKADLRLIVHSCVALQLEQAARQISIEYQTVAHKARLINMILTCACH